MQSTTSITM